MGLQVILKLFEGGGGRKGKVTVLSQGERVGDEWLSIHSFMG